MPVCFKSSKASVLICKPPTLSFIGVSALEFSLPASTQQHAHSSTTLRPGLTSQLLRKRRSLSSEFSSGSSASCCWDAPTESIRTTFNNIDKDSKGHITEADLQQYAAAHKLPASYIRPFLNAIQQQQQQQLYGSGEIGFASPTTEPDGEVSFAAFEEFVSAREDGLKQAFRHFDIDGDGCISADDLHVSLARVSICVGPRSSSGCVLRTRHQAVAQLLDHLTSKDSRRVSFAEFRQYFMLLPQQGQLVEYWLSGSAALECADTGGLCRLDRSRHAGTPAGHLLAGAVAGAASRSVTAPLETLRLAAMAGRLPSGVSLLGAAQQLVAAGGLQALYRGNMVNVMRSAPARAVDFFAFDMLKSWFGSDTYSKTFAAAGLAGMLSWALLYPLEVVRSRLTLDLHQQYKGLAHCMRTMAVQEGPAAFYKGLGPSLAAIAPEAAITYGLHDLLKRAYRQSYQRDPGILPSLWCGVVAAWTGQMVAFPLETISRRMQLQGFSKATAAAAATAAGAAGSGCAGALAAPPSAGMLEVLRSILQEGGVPALYRGLGAASLRLVPSAIVSFGAYEATRKLLLNLELQQEMAKARTRKQQLQQALTSAQVCNRNIQQLQAAGITHNPCTVCDQHGNVATMQAGDLATEGSVAAIHQQQQEQPGDRVSLPQAALQCSAAAGVAQHAAAPKACNLVGMMEGRS